VANLDLAREAPTAANVTVKAPRDYLTEREVEKLVDAARENRCTVAAIPLTDLASPCCHRPWAESAVAAGLLDEFAQRQAVAWALREDRRRGPAHPPNAARLAPSLAGWSAVPLPERYAPSPSTLARGADTFLPDLP
jgi:hypothetical protein